MGAVRSPGLPRQSAIHSMMYAMILPMDGVMLRVA